MGHPEEFKRFGYLTDKPCFVCGGQNHNQIVPRFEYVSCIDHEGVPPTHKERAQAIYAQTGSLTLFWHWLEKERNRPR